MTVIVAGGTRGIGLELASALPEKGELVVLGYGSDRIQAEAAVARLEEEGHRVRAVLADLSSYAGAQELMAKATESSEGVRTVVHCAVRVVEGRLLDIDPTRVEHTLAVNGTSLLWLTREAVPHMSPGGSLLYLTSRGSSAVIPGYETVGPAKALAEGLVKYLAVELAPRGIRINCLAPASQDTQTLRQVFGDHTDEVIEAGIRKNPSGRAVEPADYAGVARFLGSSAASMVTGQTMFVYGGANLLA